MKDIFGQFGVIDELVLMKENGVSKGCAFIKFRQKEDALLAIRALNASAFLLGSDKPIEVRFAENKKKPVTSQPITPYNPVGQMNYNYNFPQKTHMPDYQVN